jgi:hypothetical protein
VKKKFILFFGVGWCGTTSLWKTLHYEIPYLHTGHYKENFYLRLFFVPSYFNNVIQSIPHTKFLLQQIQKSKNNKQFKPLKKFSKEDLLFDPDTRYLENISLEHYANYYIKLAEYCGDDYQAVGDFTNTNNFIEHNHQLEQIKTLLEPHFDIKCLIIFRDPIRRLFSNQCFSYNSPPTKHKYNNYSPNSSSNSDHFEMTDGVISNILRNKRFDPISNYARKVNQLYDVFGNDKVCYLIMEDFFSENNKKEVSKLEKFLDITIPKIHPCCFVPDKGINAPKIEGLQDQWVSDTEILTPEFYNEIRTQKEYIDVYTEFENLHGSLPADWGRPIDYEY